MSYVLTLDAGSSSIKFALFEAGADLKERVRGQIEGLGAMPRLKADIAGATAVDKTLGEKEVTDYASALAAVLAFLDSAIADIAIAAVGHRIVHGGTEFSEPIVLDERILAALARLSPLAPLHQPHNLSGVRAAQEAFPEALQVACFDTAFHRAHPWVNDTYALPRELFDQGVRRYGFHGLSYEISRPVLRICHRPAEADCAEPCCGPVRDPSRQRRLDVRHPRGTERRLEHGLHRP